MFIILMGYIWTTINLKIDFLVLKIMDLPTTKAFLMHIAERFDEAVRPLLREHKFREAAVQLESLIETLPPRTDQLEVPSGLNYCLSLSLLHRALTTGRPSVRAIMREYEGYAAQIRMWRPSSSY